MQTHHAINRRQQMQPDRTGAEHLLPVDRPAALRVMQAADGKAFATLQARAALVGLRLGVLAETHGVGFHVLTQMGASHGLADLAAVAVFLRWAGVPQ